MSTLEATVSMLEAMPEEARAKVFVFTQNLFTSNKPANPFVPLTEEKVLSDLNISRQEISNGEGLNMREIHKYTPKSVEKTVYLNVFLGALIVSQGFYSKTAIQKLSEN